MTFANIPAESHRFYASQEEKITRMLIEKGADVNAKSEIEYSALLYAASNGKN